jgi:hypothetical protein
LHASGELVHYDDDVGQQNGEWHNDAEMDFFPSPTSPTIAEPAFVAAIAPQSTPAAVAPQAAAPPPAVSRTVRVKCRLYGIRKTFYSLHTLPVENSAVLIQKVEVADVAENFQPWIVEDVADDEEHRYRLRLPTAAFYVCVKTLPSGPVKPIARMTSVAQDATLFSSHHENHYGGWEFVTFKNVRDTPMELTSWLLGKSTMKEDDMKKLVLKENAQIVLAGKVSTRKIGDLPGGMMIDGPL